MANQRNGDGVTSGGQFRRQIMEATVWSIHQASILRLSLGEKKKSHARSEKAEAKQSESLAVKDSMFQESAWLRPREMSS